MDVAGVGVTAGELCVVVSYYDARPPAELERLLRQIRDSGFDLRDVLVVVNSVGDATLKLADGLERVETAYRRNSGFNMGAWDFGWRSRPRYRNYLFLQDECAIVRSDWSREYTRMLDDEHGMAIVGESLQYWWSWAQLGRMSQPVLSACRGLASSKEIALGKSPTHLQTLVVAASNSALTRLGGFVLADEKVEAIASEILFSRHAIASGYCIHQSARRPFEFFGHEQWDGIRGNAVGLRWFVTQSLKRVLLR